VKVFPAKRLEGEIHVPGDKSISHRAVMLASIANGESRIGNFATSADCAATIKCFRRMGVIIGRDGNHVVVAGKGKRGLTAAAGPLDCGNSGTTMRLMSGILAGQPFESILTGDESLRSRPMKRVMEPLTKMGASIESVDGRAPLTIRGGRLSAMKYELPVASAQVKSCALLAGLYAEGRTTVIEPTPTRDHTERMLRGFGIEVATNELDNGRREISLDCDADLNATDLFIPGDISSAAFFLVAAACLRGSKLRLVNVGVNPTRAAVLDALRRFGARIEVQNYRESSGEPVADLVVRSGIDESGSGDNILKGDIIANLIDEIPILAVLGTQLENGLEIRDARELRVKESDRIASIVKNLRAMNADIEEFDDGFRVGRSELKGAAVDSFGDHRIAMAFAVAGLVAEGVTEIAKAECAAVSFPAFFEVLSEVTQ
jgi:3-phosphoshikimate 1-carboxyvinyltransferase